MAVRSEVNLGKLAGEQRLDAEYYEPALLAFERTVKDYRGGWKTLGAMAELITDGDHLKRDYQDEGVLFLTAENFSEHYIDYRSSLRISPTYESTLARARSEPGAIFLTKTGRWYGKAAVCLRAEPAFNIPADVAKIRLRREHDPYFVACYLNSTIGYALVRRESSGASRDRIVLENLRTLPVPIVAQHEGFRRVVVEIDRAFQEADRCYTEAETMLSEALGLGTLDLADQTAYTAIFSQLARAERLDAEYFQPKHDRLVAHLGDTGAAVRLGDYLREPARRGLQPGYDDKGDVVVIKSQHVGKQGIELEGQERTTSSFVRKYGGKGRVRKHDVLLNSTGVITIGRAQALLESMDAVVDSHVTILRPTEELDPVYLALFLNTQPGFMQTERGWTGSSGQIELGPDAVENFVVWLAPEKIQQDIRARVEARHEGRSRARRLLDRAGALVEGAIFGTS